MIIAEAKMSAYERVSINAEELFEKYGEFAEEIRFRI